MLFSGPTDKGVPGCDFPDGGPELRQAREITPDPAIERIRVPGRVLYRR